MENDPFLSALLLVLDFSTIGADILSEGKVMKRIGGFILRVIGWVLLIAAWPLQELDLFSNIFGMILTLAPGVSLLMLAEKISPSRRDERWLKRAIKKAGLKLPGDFNECPRPRTSPRE